DELVRVADVNSAAIDEDARRGTELARSGSVRADLRDERPGGAHVLDAARGRFRDPQAVPAVAHQVARSGELAVPRAGGAEGAQTGACRRVQDHDAPSVRVGRVDVTVGS